MPEKKEPAKARTAKEAASAPELPAHVAREFGLHHGTGTGTNAEAASSNADAKDIPSASTVDDPKTDSAVEAILAKESDEQLAAQDMTHAPEPPKHRGFWAKVGHFFAAWWRNKRARWATLGILLLAAGTLMAIPQTRYVVLNTVGVRSSASVIVLDETTGLPLKNVTVTFDNSKALTDIDGRAKLTGLKLGEHTMVIRRIAFAQYEQSVTIGWGSNPLGEYKLKAVGLQYVLHMTDFLSGKPIEGVEATSDQANALSDKQGKIILTVEDTDVTTLAVTVGGAGYRPEVLTLDAAATTDTEVALVPDQKEVFVSKESGTYDVYSIDVDGKNRKLLLAGTGNENNNISLVVSPDGTQAALVSTRDNRRNNDGYLLQTLTFIDITDGTGVTVDHAEQIQLVDWLGSRLVYRSTIAGASAANAGRNRLVSYNFKTNARMQLATANQFSIVMSAQGNLYYGASSTDPHATLGLFKIKPDGSGRERLSSPEVWAGLRSSYDTLSLQTPTGWYTYDLDTARLEKTAAPATFASYAFAEDPKGQRSVWTDTRDGKGVLLLRNLQNNKTTTLATQPGITYPVRWAGNAAVVYRVATSGESAEYVVSPDGGTPRKIIDVTATYGYMQAY